MGDMRLSTPLQDFSACLKMSQAGGGVGRVENEGVLIRLLNMSSVIQVIWR